jgi:hypothetical protein
MEIRSPSPLIGYLATLLLFVGANALLPNAREAGFWDSAPFIRNPAQTVGGLIPDGLMQLDQVKIRHSIAVLPSVAWSRKFGNSIRLALGQDPEWIFAGGKDPAALFITNELWVSRGLNPRIQREIDRVAGVIGDYRRELDKEGWTLVVVPVPTKLGIHREWAIWPLGGADLLSRNPLPSDRSDEVYGAFLRALGDQHVNRVDVQSAYRGALSDTPGLILYPRSETHWSGEGIRIAALVTAKAIAASTSLAERTPESPTYLVVDHVGDLAQGYDALPGFMSRLASISVYRDRLWSGEEGRGYPASTDPKGLVFVAGTSYTGQYSSLPAPVSFAWQLGLHLQDVEILNRPMAGQGSFKSFAAFWEQRRRIHAAYDLRRGPAGAHVIVWEMPIRDIPGIGTSTLSWDDKQGWR